MLALLPLAMLIALLVSAPSLWEAFNDPQVDLFPILLRLLIVALIADVVLHVANRLIAKHLAHPSIDLPEPPEVIVAQSTEVVKPAETTISVATVAEIPDPLTDLPPGDSVAAIDRP